jgi:XTP/dITP diphosphohydrolase
MPLKVFIATQNPKKLQELTQILGNTFELLSFLDLAVQEVEETESTLEGNAILKAKSYYEQVKIPCIADDTGLEVEILGGEPGVLSARYAGEPSNSTKNIEKLLFQLKNQQAWDISQRKAQFRTVIAYFNGKDIHTFEGIIKGHIALEPKGTQGFGYDPVFIPEGFNQTFAEMNPEQKNQISHRSLALQKLKKFLTFAL